VLLLLLPAGRISVAVKEKRRNRWMWKTMSFNAHGNGKLEVATS